ncbi:MAG: hypothetical protein V8R75_02040 [Oscillospiraceae bacterium]
MAFVIWSSLSTASFDFWNNFSGNYVFIVTAGLGAIGNNYIFGTRLVLDSVCQPWQRGQARQLVCAFGQVHIRAADDHRHGRFAIPIPALIGREYPALTYRSYER